MSTAYATQAPSRAEVDALQGVSVIEFGTDWCGYCQAAQPLIEIVSRDFPDVRHLKIEDGPGRALGRSFKVTLWPTLVFFRDGEEVTRLVRPSDASAIEEAFEALVGEG